MDGWTENGEGIWEKFYASGIRGSIARHGAEWKGLLRVVIRIGGRDFPMNIPFPHCDKPRLTDVMSAADSAFAEYRRVFS